MRTFTSFPAGDKENRLIGFANEGPGSTPPPPDMPEAPEPPQEAPQPEVEVPADAEAAIRESAQEAQKNEQAVIDEATNSVKNADSALGGAEDQVKQDAGVQNTGNDLWAAMEDMGEVPDVNKVNQGNDSTQVDSQYPNAGSTPPPPDMPEPADIVEDRPADAAQAVADARANDGWNQDMATAKLDQAGLPGYDKDGNPLVAETSDETPADAAQAVADARGTMTLDDYEALDVANSKRDNPEKPSTGVADAPADAAQAVADARAAQAEDAPADAAQAVADARAEQEKGKGPDALTSAAERQPESRESLNANFDKKKEQLLLGRETEKAREAGKDWSTLETGKMDFDKKNPQPFLYKKETLNLPGGKQEEVLLAYSPKGGLQIMNTKTGEWIFLNDIPKNQRGPLEKTAEDIKANHKKVLDAEKAADKDGYDKRVERNANNHNMEEVCLKNRKANRDWFQKDGRGKDFWKDGTGNEYARKALEDSKTAPAGDQIAAVSPAEAKPAAAAAEAAPAAAPGDAASGGAPTVVGAGTTEAPAGEGGAKPPAAETGGAKPAEATPAAPATPEATPAAPATPEAAAEQTAEDEATRALEAIKEAKLQLEKLEGQTTDDAGKKPAEAGTDATPPAATEEPKQPETLSDGDMRKALMAEVRNNKTDPKIRKVAEVLSEKKADLSKIEGEGKEKVDAATAKVDAQDANVKRLEAAFNLIPDSLPQAVKTAAKGFLEQAKANLETSKQELEQAQTAQKNGAEGLKKQVTMLEDMKKEVEDLAKRSEKQFDQMGSELMNTDPVMGNFVEQISVAHDGSLGFKLEIDTELADRLKDFMGDKKDEKITDNPGRVLGLVKALSESPKK